MADKKQDEDELREVTYIEVVKSLFRNFLRLEHDLLRLARKTRNISLRLNILTGAIIVMFIWLSALTLWALL